MKGILKIYHPDETLKYHIKSSYCKAVYSNQKHLLEVEVTTDDGLDHVDDDSLQYRFPQLSFDVFDYPLASEELVGETIKIPDSEDEEYTEVDLFDDEEAYLYSNELTFSRNAEGELELLWKGEIDDFYTGSDEQIPFKLKCHFKEEDLEVEEE